jgi:hypothetical protein
VRLADDDVVVGRPRDRVEVDPPLEESINARICRSIRPWCGRAMRSVAPRTLDGAMAFLRYTLLRVLLFVVVAALLWIAGVRGFWLLLLAVFGSGVVSVFVLSRSRDAASASLANRVSNVRGRMRERTVAEDAWDDQRRVAPPERRPPGSAPAEE